MAPEDIYPGMRFLYYREDDGIPSIMQVYGEERWYIGTIIRAKGPSPSWPNRMAYIVHWDWQSGPDDMGGVDNEYIMPLFEAIPCRPCGNCDNPAYLVQQDYLCVTCRKNNS